MWRRSIMFSFLLVAAAANAGAQRGGNQRNQHYHGNGGHIPPAPSARARAGRPEVQTFPGGKVDGRPHVWGSRWYGHDRKGDAHFRVSRPYPHGRFARVGSSFHYHVARYNLGARRFWFAGGFGFEIAAWDWPFAESWCWTCPDDIIIYDDPDHPGWYLVYDTETGVYVHAQYIGS